MIDWDKPLEVRKSIERWREALKYAIFFNKDGSVHYYQIQPLDNLNNFIFFSPEGRQLFVNNGWQIRNSPEKKKIEGWINVFLEDRNRVGLIYTNKEEADRCAHHDRTACIYIEKEYTEGEGLEGGE